MLLVLTTKSLSILFRPVPRWISPVGYGGPSCRTNNGLPLRTSRMRSYRFSSCQAASCLGSFCGKLAFMGKSVFGRFSVFLSSRGSDMGRLCAIPFFYAVISLGVWRETSESSVNSVCYNGLVVGVSRKGGCNHSLPLGIVPFVGIPGHPSRGFLTS